MLTSLWSLWLPILVSGVALFIASWAAWMLLPHHKNDWRALPNEEAIVSAIRGSNLPPGQYMFPRAATPQDWKTEEFKRRVQAGPNGTLTVWEGASNMGVNLLCTLLFFLVANSVIAYLAGMVIAPGENFLAIFRFVATAGVLTYGTANILNGIWFRRRTIADIADGIAYGLITGAIFAALWPSTPA